jgi:prophage regulatory protein
MMTTKSMTPESEVVVDGPIARAPTRLLRLPEVMARVGLKRSSIYQRMSEGRFPKSRSLGPKCAVWIEAEVDAWVREIAAQSPTLP